MKRVKLFLVLVTVSIAIGANAQVTIGSQDAPPAGALLNLNNANDVKKGLLLPHVTLPVDLTQWGLDGSSIDGMVVYNIATGKEGVYTRVNGVWVPMIVSTEGTTGTFTDPSDGKTYTTQDFGTAGVWTTQNLAKEVVGSIPTENPVNGRLYTPSQAQAACPDGWHLPSDAEWTALETYINQTYNGNAAITPDINSTFQYRGTFDVAMRVPSVWNRAQASSPRPEGTNTSGFNGVPSAYYINGVGYKEDGFAAMYVSSTPSPTVGSYYGRVLHISQQGMARWEVSGTFASAIRCVKNN